MFVETIEGYLQSENQQWLNSMRDQKTDTTSNSVDNTPPTPENTNGQ
ncbi:hypothetical protein [Flavobacterium sp. 3HN19-14]